MTELAYLASMEGAYTRTFRARIVAHPPGALVLDRTFFYPTGGGQPNDRGALKVVDRDTSVEVLDVAKQGSSVVHRVRGAPAAVAAFSPGTEVEGTIDWTRRHRHMRLHTAQHFVSARIFARSGVRTRRAQLRDVEASINLEAPLSDDLLEAVVQEARAAPAADLAVRIRTVARSEWDAHPSARSGLVPLAAHVDPVRLIEIDGVDLCPCGGTHVRSTAELGVLEFRPTVPTDSGGVRLSFTLADASGPIRSG